MLMVMLWNGVPFINHTCEYIIRTMVWHAFHFICFALSLWISLYLSLSYAIYSILNQIKSCFYTYKNQQHPAQHTLNSSVDASFLCSNPVFPSFITHFESNIIDDSAKMQLIDTPHFMDSFITYYTEKKKLYFHRSVFSSEKPFTFFGLFKSRRLSTSHILHVACVQTHNCLSCNLNRFLHSTITIQWL